MKSYLNKNFNFNEYLFTILFEFENKIHITKNNIVFQFIAPDFKKKKKKKRYHQNDLRKIIKHLPKTEKYSGDRTLLRPNLADRDGGRGDVQMNIAENVDFSNSFEKTDVRITNASVHWNHLYLVMLTHVTLRHALSYIPTHDCLNISTRKVVRAFLMIY